MEDDDSSRRGVRHDRFTTSDPGQAADVIQESYRVTGGVRISGDTDGFHFTQDVMDAGDFALGRFQCGVEVGYAGPLGGLLCVEQIHAGRLSFETARDELRTRAGDVCLVPPHEPWRAFTDEVDLAPLVLDHDAVARAAAGMSGIDPGALRFTGLEPISPATARYWNVTVEHIRHDVLGDAELAAAPLVRAEAFRALATGMILMFPNTALEALRVPGTVRGRSRESGAVRRAAQFMDANAHRDIDITEIAEAAGVGPRGLQAAFRHHRGEAPMQYLRRVRMEGAHRDLVAADPTRGNTVGGIAARWGFSNPGRFAVDYRRAYGCSPSATLRR